MPFSPEQAEAMAGGLRTTFDNLEAIILEKVAGKLQTGTALPSWASDKLAALNALKRDVDSLVKEFSKGVDDYVGNAVQSAYVQGVQGADDDFKEAGKNVEKILQTAIRTTGTPMNIVAIKALVAEATGAISSMQFNILRKTEDIYRQTIAKTATATISGAETKLQTVQRVINDFADSGIAGFTDKAGRNWSMGAYADMAVRTAVGRAAQAGHEMRINELGEDLVIISQHPDECPLCRDYEGKIFSISGTSDKYPPLANAKSGGLFHPNCAHVATAYFEGYSSPMPQKIGKPTDYEEKQRQREIERQIRKWKKRVAVAMTPQEKAKADAKLKEWQGVMRKFIIDTGRRRKYEREKADFGAKPDPSKFKTKPLPKTAVNIDPAGTVKPPKQKPPEPATPPKQVEQTKPIEDAEATKPLEVQPEKTEQEKLIEAGRKQIEETLAFNHVDKAYREHILKRYDSADDEAKLLFATWYDKDKMNEFGMKGAHDESYADHWSPSRQKIFMRYDDDNKGAFGIQEPSQVFFHEVGHMIDNLSGLAIHANEMSKYGKYSSLMNKYAKEYKKHFRAEIKKLIAEIESEVRESLEKNDPHFAQLYSYDQIRLITKKTKDRLRGLFGDAATAGLSDAISGVTKDNYRGVLGHRKSYWTRNPHFVEVEGFANMFQAMFFSGHEDIFKKYMPKAHEAFRKMIRELI